MAWIFSLPAECGADESKVSQFARHFRGIEWTLSNSRSCQSINGIPRFKQSAK